VFIYKLKNIFWVHKRGGIQSAAGGAENHMTLEGIKITLFPVPPPAEFFHIYLTLRGAKITFFSVAPQQNVFHILLLSFWGNKRGYLNQGANIFGGTLQGQTSLGQQTGRHPLSSLYWLIDIICMLEAKDNKLGYGRNKSILLQHFLQTLNDLNVSENFKNHLRTFVSEII
jgi:hypothetical protein